MRDNFRFSICNLRLNGKMASVHFNRKSAIANRKFPAHHVSRLTFHAAPLAGIATQHSPLNHWNPRPTPDRTHPCSPWIASRSTPTSAAAAPASAACASASSHLLELLAAGASHEEILADYAFLEPADIQAARLYAARLTDHTLVPAISALVKQIHRLSPRNPPESQPIAIRFRSPTLSP